MEMFSQQIEQGQAALQLQEYDRAIQSFQAAIELDPQQPFAYWYLGIAFLLNGQEEEGQFTWLAVLSEVEDNSEIVLDELLLLLDNQANLCEQQGAIQNAWLLRRHGYELCPTTLENLLRLIQLSLTPDQSKAIDFEELEGWLNASQEQLQALPPNTVDAELLLSTLQSLLAYAPEIPQLPSWIVAVAPQVANPLLLMACILPKAVNWAYGFRQPKVAASLIQAYLTINPQNLEMLGHLASFYQDATEYDRGIQIAQERLALSTTLPDVIYSSHLLLRGLLSAGGYWDTACATMEQHREWLSSIKPDLVLGLHSAHTLRLMTASYYLPYFSDTAENRRLQNQVVQACQDNIQHYSQAAVQRYQQRHRQKQASHASPAKLRIGYISHCLVKHSVGWLARWLIQHHDRDRLTLYGYLMHHRPQDALQDWYINQFEKTYFLDRDFADDTTAMAEQIYQDEIDILIDLDSITLDVTCEILAMKPAPIQVSWLGWDAIGMSAIDYFIVDPYVLPEQAQSYYTEKLWRLPETYIAVDGFEVGVPTLRRSDLALPEDAVVYLTAQRGYKRHRETAKLQMQVIHAVPNSYLLIKGFADNQSIQQFFYEIADEVGVPRDRLRFLSGTPSEAVHRANLRIADVVLDTYPYNGATTTLETLWMEVPIVTWVGKQFAARNSYTMMMNAGITEGIAWSAEEYVEWGIKLGTDLDLRKQVVWKLHQSKQFSPLWNGKQFAQEIEKALISMWKQFTSQT